MPPPFTQGRLPSGLPAIPLPSPSVTPSSPGRLITSAEGGEGVPPGEGFSSPFHQKTFGIFIDIAFF